MLIPTLEDLHMQIVERYDDIEWADEFAPKIHEVFTSTNNILVTRALNRTKGEPFRRTRLHPVIAQVVAELLYPSPNDCEENSNGRD